MGRITILLLPSLYFHYRFLSSLAPSFYYDQSNNLKWKQSFVWKKQNLIFRKWNLTHSFLVQIILKIGSTAYIFLIVPGLTGKKFSLKISGKQKRFHVSSGSGFLVCTPIYSPMRFVFVIKHVTHQNMLLLMDVLGVQVFLELPLFSVTFYPSRYNFFWNQANIFQGNVYRFQYLIGSQKGLYIRRLSPNVIFSDAVLAFEYFLKTKDC